MNLLSDNDLRTIQTALDARLEIEMVRTLGPVSVSVRTLRVGHPWPVWVHTIAQVRKENGHIMSVQNFTSVEEMRRYL